MSTYHKIQSVWKRNRATGAFLPAFSCDEFEFLAPCDWDWSEKAHGTNIRVCYGMNPESTGYDRMFRGRSEKSDVNPRLMERLDELFPEEKLAEAFERPGTSGEGGGVVLHGEGIGPGINDSRLSPDGFDFVLFDVRIGRWWLTRENVAGIAQKFGLNMAPTVGRGPLAMAVELVKEGFDSTLGSAAPGTPAEGLVLRPAIELAARNGSRIITKLKTKDFTL